MSHKRGKYAFNVAAASALLAVSMGMQPAMAKQAGSGFQGAITMYAGAYGPPFTQLSSAVTGPQATVLASLAKEYEKLHPGITIKFVPSPPAGQAYNTWVMTKAAGGQLPDITEQTPVYVETFPPGVFIRLNPYFNQPDPYVPGKKWGQLFQPKIMSEISSENGLGGNYVINGDFVATAFYYNKTLFQKVGIRSVPTTWSAFIRDCAILKKAGHIPFAWDVSGSSTGEGHNMGWMTRLFYSNFFAGQYRQLEFTKHNGITTEDQVIAIKKGIYGNKNPRWMALWPIMKAFSQYWQPDVEGGDANGQGPMLLFLRGNTGMYMDGSWASPQIASAKPKFQWGTFKVPRPDRATSKFATKYGYPGTGGPYGGGFNYAVSSQKSDSTMTPQKLKAVVNWLEFITTPRRDQAVVNQIGEYVPTVIGAKPLPQLINLTQMEKESLNMVFGGVIILPQEEQAIYRAYQSYILGQMSLTAFGNQAEQQLENAANQLIAQHHWNLSKYLK